MAEYVPQVYNAIAVYKILHIVVSHNQQRLNNNQKQPTTVKPTIIITIITNLISGNFWI